MTVTSDPMAAYGLGLPAWLDRWFIYYGYSKAADHLHEVVFFALAYTALYKLSRVVSPIVLPAYRQLSPRTKVNFDMHVVSQIQALFICAASLPLFWDKHLTSLTSSTPYSGFVNAAATGYFLWDLVVSWKYRRLFGLPFLAHALAALATFAQGLRPFLHNYSAPFIWFEASTPFVNNHWFGTHVPGLLSDKLQAVNGLVLILVFFGARIVSGAYNGYYLFKEVFTRPPSGIPGWVVLLILTTYTVLTSLNLYWFSKMLATALSRLRKKEE